MARIQRTIVASASAVAIGWLVSVVAWAASAEMVQTASMEMVRAASGSKWDSARKVRTHLVESVGRVQGRTLVRLAITDSPVASLGLDVPQRLVAMHLVVEVSIVASVSVVVDE